MQAYVEVTSGTGPVERDLIFNHLSCIEKVRPRQRIVLTFKILDSGEVGWRQLGLEDMRLVPFLANLGLRVRNKISCIYVVIHVEVRSLLDWKSIK
jgi:hypothetical protein